MRFIEIISQKKFTLISIFLFLYVSLNLFVGERGLISYYENQKLRKELIQKKNKLIADLNSVEKINSLLTSEIDLDYLEILYRQKFMLGKSNEKVYTNIK
jgi:cell division protein DivIC